MDCRHPRAGIDLPPIRSHTDPEFDLHPGSGEASEVMEQFYKLKTKNLMATLVEIDAHDDDRRWCSTTCSILGP